MYGVTICCQADVMGTFVVKAEISVEKNCKKTKRFLVTPRGIYLLFVIPFKNKIYEEFIKKNIYSP